MDGGGTQLHIVEVVTEPSLRRARQQPTHAIHREGRHHAEPVAGAPTTDTSEPALLDADLADPPEMQDSQVIATPWGHPAGHPAGALETIWIHTMDIEGTRSRQGVRTRAEGWAAEARTRMAGVRTSLDRDNLTGRVTRLLRMEGRQHGSGWKPLEWRLRTGPSVGHAYVTTDSSNGAISH
jgi:hypothetical protein